MNLHMIAADQPSKWLVPKDNYIYICLHTVRGCNFEHLPHFFNWVSQFQTHPAHNKSWNYSPLESISFINTFTEYHVFHHPQLDPKSGHSQQFSTHICTNDRSARAVHLRSMPRQALLGQGVHGGSGVVWCLWIVNPWALIYMQLELKRA